MRGAIPDGLSIVTSNALILAGAALRRSGLAVFLGQKRHFGVGAVVTLLWVALCFFPPFRENLVARINYLYSFLILNCLWIVWMAFRDNREKLRSVRLLGVTMLSECAAFVWFVLHQNLHTFPDYLSSFPESFMTVYLVTLLFSSIMTFVLPPCMVIERSLLGFKEQALQDALTGLPNRRAFLDNASSWVADRKSEEQVYSVIMLDLDRFNSVNETFSNAMGDAVLRLFGRVLKDTTGENAMQGRITGEEFVVFLPGADKEFAMLTAQRICRQFGHSCQEASEGKLLVSASVGLVTTHSGVDLERAMEVAGRGLHKAKQQGQAQVVAMDLTPGGGLTKSSRIAGFSFLRKKVA
ncbi:MAG: GGDEF domain-containing protein [Roseibium sp.]|nr:GGDEF domain-containing protein [Roseibium sp.]